VPAPALVTVINRCEASMARIVHRYDEMLAVLAHAGFTGHDDTYVLGIPTERLGRPEPQRPWTQDLGKEGAPAFEQYYKETPRYVFSDTLQAVSEGVTIVRRKDAVSAVTRLKAGGRRHPEPAASLLDLIDEFWVYAFP
jgi:hypothetical protein